MAVTIVLAVFSIAFWGVTAAKRFANVGTWLLAIVAFVLFMELARYDQGQPDVLFYVGMIVAPVIAIFGGASWGTRKFYGWPNFGPQPSRAALVAAAVLLGVLTGLKYKLPDVQATETRLQAWYTAGAADPIPATTLGWLRPPHAVRLTTPAGAVLGFPIGNGRWRAFLPAEKEWRTLKVEPTIKETSEADRPAAR